MTTKPIAMLAMAALTLLTGCLTAVSDPESACWTLEYSDDSARRAEKPKYGVVRLALVEMRAPYSAREIAVLRAGGSVAFDQVNSYAAHPVQLMKGVAFEALDQSGLFKAVVGSSSAVDEDVSAEVVVRRIALDCRVEDKRKAVADVSVRLVRSGEIVASAQGEGSADASGPDFSASLSAAASAAFTKALKSL